MQARKVPAAHGWLWIKQAFDLFRKSPLLWMILTAIGVVGIGMLFSIPVVGMLLALILMPLLLAGFMLGARDLLNGGELELAHLFGGLKHNASELVSLGGINLVGQLLINIIAAALIKMAGGEKLVALIEKHVEDQQQLAQAMASTDIRLMLTAITIAAVLFILLMMAMQFAPLLVMFHHMTPLRAMKTSLNAFLSNVLPLTVYSVVLIPLAIAASIPMMAGWVFLLPVVIASMYIIYIDLFPAEHITEGDTE